MAERRARTDVAIMQFMSWSWPEYLATPLSRRDVVVRELQRANAEAED